MLSNPLPDSMALPDSVQNFTRTLLDAAVREPSAASFRAVHQVLNGTKTILLNTIPESVIGAFVVECRQVLESLKDENIPFNAHSWRASGVWHSTIMCRD